jgi:hypothetical protein
MERLLGGMSSADSMRMECYMGLEHGFRWKMDM